MNATRRRSRRGFSLLEVLVASAIFLFGVTALTAMVANASLVTRKGVMNTQMTQVARDQVRTLVTGAVYPVAVPMVPSTEIPITGVRVRMVTEVFDTGGAAGAEAPEQLPGCRNLAYPSQCVRVTATDSILPCNANSECSSNRCLYAGTANSVCVGPSGLYQVESYVVQ